MKNSINKETNNKDLEQNLEVDIEGQIESERQSHVNESFPNNKYQKIDEGNSERKEEPENHQENRGDLRSIIQTNQKIVYYIFLALLIICAIVACAVVIKMLWK
jgi:magnesium-transporting ATPase (P-type)